MRPVCLYYAFRQAWFAWAAILWLAGAAGAAPIAPAPQADAAAASTAPVIAAPSEAVEAAPAPSVSNDTLGNGAIGNDTLGNEVVDASAQRPYEIWQFSTRHLHGNCLYQGAIPQVYRCAGTAGWQPSSVDEFHKTSDPGAVTVFFIHGNRIDSTEAIDQGLSAFTRMRFGAENHPRVRYVIWSWPSEPMIPVAIARDAEIKAGRTDAEAHYVASVLATIPADCPVSFIGFSFGARITAGALHLLGGGSTLGYRLAETPAPRTVPIRAVLVAAAIDCDWLAPGGRYGLAMAQLDRLFMLVNTRDFVLSHYAQFSSHRGVEAAGLVGLCCAPAFGDDWSRIAQHDVARLVGVRHAWTNYLSAPGVMAMIRDETLSAAR